MIHIPSMCWINTLILRSCNPSLHILLHHKEITVRDGNAQAGSYHLTLMDGGEQQRQQPQDRAVSSKA